MHGLVDELRSLPLERSTIKINELVELLFQGVSVLSVAA